MKQETVVPNEMLELVIRNALTGDERHLEICRNSTLRDLQAVLHTAFDIPPFEQVLLHEGGNTVFGDGRFNDIRPIGSVPEICSDIPLMIMRKLDTRPQAEKNCAFLEALREGKLDEAMNVLDSSGVLVDPNCVGSFAHEGPSFLAGGGHARDFGDIRSSKMPALCMAVMARCTWSPAGRVTGERADETSVVQMVGRLLAMGASVEELQNEVLTCGSWPDTILHKTALYLAVQTRSSALVRILLDAGADPTKGRYERQFAPGKAEPCEAALTRRRQGEHEDAVSEELRSLLRQKEYEVKIACPPVRIDTTSSTIGITVSRRDGYWGFIDEIETNGLIARWNQDQDEDRQVKVGDKIVAVCGYRAGIDHYEGTGWLVDQAGWKPKNPDLHGDCFLAYLISEPQDEIVLALTRTDRP